MICTANAGFLVFRLGAVLSVQCLVFGFMLCMVLCLFLGFDARCSVVVAQCLMLDARCLLLGACCFVDQAVTINVHSTGSVLQQFRFGKTMLHYPGRWVDIDIMQLQEAELVQLRKH